MAPASDGDPNPQRARYAAHHDKRTPVSPTGPVPVAAFLDAQPRRGVDVEIRPVCSANLEHAAVDDLESLVVREVQGRFRWAKHVESHVAQCRSRKLRARVEQFICPRGGRGVWSSFSRTMWRIATSRRSSESMTSISRMAGSVAVGLRRASHHEIVQTWPDGPGVAWRRIELSATTVRPCHPTTRRCHAVHWRTSELPSNAATAWP